MDTRVNTTANDVPGFGTILLDNVKTTGFFTGIGVGAVPGAIGCVADLPLMAFASRPAGGLLVPIFGSVGFAIGAAPGAAFGATFFSIPFSISAQYTRQFKANHDIQPKIDLILAFTDKHLQQFIINQIIDKDNQYAWGMRSYESACLIWKLNSSSPLEEKWETLKKYLNAKADNGSFIHNGKKLFNTILSVTDDITPLMLLQLAAQQNNLDYIKNEIKLHPELLHERDYKGRTILHYAMMNKCYDTLEYLVCSKDLIINLNIEIDCPGDKDHGKNVLFLASERKATDMISMLLDADARIIGIHPIHIAAKLGDLNTVKKLLADNNELLNLRDKFGGTSLMHAASNGNFDIVSYLTKQIAIDIHATASAQEYYQCTALDCADIKGHSKISNYLVALGADVTDKRKSELKLLVDILNYYNNQSGLMLFNKNSPELALRTYLSSNQLLNKDNIDALDRDQVRKHIGNLQKYIPKDNAFAGDNKKIIYSFVEKLGQNKVKDLKKLNMFRSNDADVNDKVKGMSLNN